MWQVALGWHAIEFAQTSPILKFYIWFRFRPYHCSRHVILHQSEKFYPNRITLGRKWFSRWRISAILDFRSHVLGSLKSPCTTSCRSSIDTSSKLLSFWKNRVFCILATDKQRDERMDSIDALSRSRCRERRLNNLFERPLLSSLSNSKNKSVLIL